MIAHRASGSMRRASSSLIWLLLRVIALVSVVLLVQRPEDRSRAGDGVARLLQSDACAVGAVRPAPRLVLRVAPPPAPGAVSCGAHQAFLPRPFELLALASPSSANPGFPSISRSRSSAIFRA